MSEATVFDVMHLTSVGNNDLKFLQHFLEKVLQIYSVTVLRNKSSISKSQAKHLAAFLLTQISREVAD